MEKKALDIKRYTDSVFYEVSLTGKYIKKMAEQHFKNLKLELTCEEFPTLDLIYQNGNKMCQRDLALKLLINRANMGKILSGLEKKGYLIRTTDLKLNRPVKLVQLTKEGEKIYLNTVTTLKKTAEKPLSNFSEEEAKNLINGVKKMRKILAEIVEIDI